MRALLITLLVGYACGAKLEDRPRRQLNFGFGNRLESSLGGGYLPPDKTPQADCRPSTVYVPTTRVSNVVVPTTVYNRDVQYVTQTRYSTRVVPTTIVSNVIRTQVVPSIVYQTRYVTNTQYRTQTQVVTLPANYQSEHWDPKTSLISQTTTTNGLPKALTCQNSS